MNTKTSKEKIRVLIADDENDTREILKASLESAGFEVFVVSNSLEAVSKAKYIIPDLIILDIMMPGKNGYEVKKDLANEESLEGIPVIFLSARDSTEDKVEGLSLGVDDYITKPFNRKELIARVNSILGRRKHYEKIATTDGLTGLHNRHYLRKQLALFFSIAKRYKKSFAVLFIDVNDFKEINDVHGHLAGDYVLKKIAKILLDTLRKSDIPVRFGGDEFVALLTETDYEKAENAAARITEALKKEAFKFGEPNKTIPVTVSIGISTYNEEFKDENEMLEQADKHMYRKK